MPGKRQHYVPDFLLRRFAIGPSAKTKRVYRLDKATGKPEVRSTINEAVIGRYYEYELNDGTPVTEADKALDIIENLAVGVLRRLEAPAYVGTDEDRLIMMLFIASLQRRTPRAREALREFSERSAEVFLEMQVSDKEAFHKGMGGKGKSEAEVEEGRQRLLKLLREDQIRAEATADHEIPLMFIALGEVVNTLFVSLGVACARIASDSKRTFVLSDHPVSHYDGLAPTPEAGISFLSSPAAMTWVPLDPKFGLLLAPDEPGTWQNIEADDSDIDELNLLTYAWARDAIYGCSQQAVTDTMHYAKTHPKLVGEFHYRPHRFWVSKTGNPKGGPTILQSRHRGKATERTIVLRGDVKRTA